MFRKSCYHTHFLKLRTCKNEYMNPYSRIVFHEECKIAKIVIPLNVIRHILGSCLSKNIPHQIKIFAICRILAITLLD